MHIVSFFGLIFFLRSLLLPIIKTNENQSHETYAVVQIEAILKTLAGFKYAARNF